MKELFAIAALAIALFSCNNEKKVPDESKPADTTAIPSQAAAADSLARAVDSAVNPPDSTKK